MTVRATILGCGSSGGVPRVGGDWGACDPEEPRNRRTRCSILVQKVGENGTTSILVDTSPDLREQLLRADVKRLDALLYTHDHADQTHGIDDLRAIAYRMRSQIPTYMDAHTHEHIVDRFRYCFEKPEGRVHPPILDLQDTIANDQTIEIDGPGGTIAVYVFAVSHGPTPSLGFVFDDALIYTPDVWDIVPETLDRITGAGTWICDGLRYASHPTHAHVDKTLSWFAHTKTRTGVLTNIHIDLDYNELADLLPPSCRPAHDGLIVTA